MAPSTSGTTAPSSGVELVASLRDVHCTPDGEEQPFEYCLFRKR